MLQSSEAPKKRGNLLQLRRVAAVSFSDLVDEPPGGDGVLSNTSAGGDVPAIVEAGDHLPPGLAVGVFAALKVLVA